MSISHSSTQINTKKSFSTKSVKQSIDLTLGNIKKLFSKSSLQEIAKEVGFIKRSSSKIRGFDFLTSLLISSIGSSHSSLERISDIIAHVSRKAIITSQAIMKRINNPYAVDFLKAVYAKILAEKLLILDDIPSEILSGFSKILLQDSSTIVLHEELQTCFKGSGGRASKASAKFDVIYDYKAKIYEQIRITDHSEADQTLSLKIEDVLTEGSLIIRDLGYLRVDSLAQIIAKKAFFLSRLRSDIHVYLNEEDTSPVDLGDFLARNCKEGVLDREVFVTNKKFRVRLVAYLTPEEVANKRRREARATAKKQGRTLKEATLTFYGFTVFITNVSKEVWKPEVVGTVYRIRWQIELIFKCWKSRLEVHYLKGTNYCRILCLIYAKLILILLVNQIYRLAEFIAGRQAHYAVSMTKVFAWMKDTERVLKIISGSMNTLDKQIFKKSIPKVMCMDVRKRKTTLERVCEGEIYYSTLS